MSFYKNTSGGNLDTFSKQNPDGSLSAKAGHVYVDEVFEAVDAIVHLKIVGSSMQAGRYIKRSGLTLQASAPPPPPVDDPFPPSDVPNVELIEMVFVDGELVNLFKNGQEWRPVL